MSARKSNFSTSISSCSSVKINLLPIRGNLRACMRCERMQPFRFWMDYRTHKRMNFFIQQFNKSTNKYHCKHTEYKAYFKVFILLSHCKRSFSWSGIPCLLDIFQRDELIGQIIISIIYLFSSTTQI